MERGTGSKILKPNKSWLSSKTPKWQLLTIFLAQLNRVFWRHYRADRRRRLEWSMITNGGLSKRHLWASTIEIGWELPIFSWDTRTRRETMQRRLSIRCLKICLAPRIRKTLKVLCMINSWRLQIPVLDIIITLMTTNSLTVFHMASTCQRQHSLIGLTKRWTAGRLHRTW